MLLLNNLFFVYRCFSRSFLYSFVCSFICSLVSWSIVCIRLFECSSVCSTRCGCTCIRHLVFVYLVICSVVCSFIRSFVLLACLLVCCPFMRASFRSLFLVRSALRVPRRKPGWRFTAGLTSCHVVSCSVPLIFLHFWLFYLVRSCPVPYWLFPVGTLFGYCSILLNFVLEIFFSTSPPAEMRLMVYRRLYILSPVLGPAVFNSFWLVELRMFTSIVSA